MKEEEYWGYFLCCIFQDQELASISLQNIKSALLKSPGPICTFYASAQSGPRQLRKMSLETYNQACESLQMDNLVSVVALKRRRGFLDILVKKPPQEVFPILQANPGLCSAEVYWREYCSAVPIKITRDTRRRLVALGHVSEKQVEYQTKKIWKTLRSSQKNVVYYTLTQWGNFINSSSLTL